MTKEEMVARVSELSGLSIATVEELFENDWEFCRALGKPDIWQRTWRKE